MPYDAAVCGFSSTFSLAMTMLSCWLAISSRIGRDHLARPAPLRPEVDDDRLVTHEDVVGEAGVRDLLGCSHDTSPGVVVVDPRGVGSGYSLAARKRSASRAAAQPDARPP
jgi:hypothetical protein